MRVFVTGGTGLVGRHVIGQLVARGDVVTALARGRAAATALTALGATPLTGGVEDAEALAKGVAAADAVVHAAAIILGGSAPWPSFHATNVAPTETIATLAARAGIRMVHLSSVAVYGRRSTYDGGPGSVSEEFGLSRPLFRGDHYARSKREAELAVWRVAEATGLSALALRPCVIYGEGDRHFSPRVARALGWPFAPLIGGGSNVLSVVYAGSVAAAVLAALDRPAVRGAFNVANDGGAANPGALTQEEFVRAFAAGLGARPRLVRIPRALARGAADALDGALHALRPDAPVAFLRTAVQFLGSANPYSSAKAARELGWASLEPPGRCAERTGRWYRDLAA